MRNEHHHESPCEPNAHHPLALLGCLRRATCGHVVGMLVRIVGLHYIETARQYVVAFVPLTPDRRAVVPVVRGVHPFGASDAVRAPWMPRALRPPPPKKVVRLAGYDSEQYLGSPWVSFVRGGRARPECCSLRRDCVCLRSAAWSLAASMTWPTRRASPKAPSTGTSPPRERFCWPCSSSTPPWPGRAPARGWRPGSSPSPSSSPPGR